MGYAGNVVVSALPDCDGSEPSNGRCGTTQFCSGTSFVENKLKCSGIAVARKLGQFGTAIPNDPNLSVKAEALAGANALCTWRAPCKKRSRTLPRPNPVTGEIEQVPYWFCDGDRNNVSNNSYKKQTDYVTCQDQS